LESGSSNRQTPYCLTRARPIATRWRWPPESSDGFRFSSASSCRSLAARVDGAGFWRVFFYIMVPMSVPITVVALILQVTGIWNDFLFGVVFAGIKNYPMTVQLNNIVNSTQGVKEYNVNMAATILTGLVPLVIYFISGKWFVRGIAAGAVKG
jgi:glucose/mannose transport system permease protein